MSVGRGFYTLSSADTSGQIAGVFSVRLDAFNAPNFLNFTKFVYDETGQVRRCHTMRHSLMAFRLCC